MDRAEIAESIDDCGDSTCSALVKCKPWLSSTSDGIVEDPFGRAFKKTSFSSAKEKLSSVLAHKNKVRKQGMHGNQVFVKIPLDCLVKIHSVYCFV